MSRKTIRILLFAAGILSAACGGGSQVTATATPVPLPEGAVAFEYDGHLRFRGVVCDSIPAELIFDTGATGLYLDSLWFSASGYVPRRSARAQMPGGAGTKTSRVQVVMDALPLRIDTIRWQTDGVTPVFDLRSILGRHADGIFGQRFLAGHCVCFNLRRGYMRAVSADTLVAAGFVRHAVEKQDDRIYVPVRVAFDSVHTVEGRFLLDMGCGGTVVVSAPAARSAGFDAFAGRTVDYATLSGGVGGAAASRYCRAASVAFGGHAFMQVPVEVSQNASGFLARGTVAGLIGNELLERFEFVIDFAAPALYLRPVKDADARFPHVAPGFSMIDRTDICDGWPVTGLYEGHAPEGLQPGDVVVAWDGRPLGTYADPDSAFRAAGRHTFRAVRGGVGTDYETETKEIL